MNLYRGQLHNCILSIISYFNELGELSCFIIGPSFVQSWWIIVRFSFMEVCCRQQFCPHQCLWTLILFCFLPLIGWSMVIFVSHEDWISLMPCYIFSFVHYIYYFFHIFISLSHMFTGIWEIQTYLDIQCLNLESYSICNICIFLCLFSLLLQHLQVVLLICYKFGTRDLVVFASRH